MPLSCEIDAYGDFLQALGPNANPQVNSNMLHITGFIWSNIRRCACVSALCIRTSLSCFIIIS